jgi:hypothetical protein
MVDVVGKAFRHPTAGRLYPGRSFTAEDLSYPANWLELATEADLAAHNITMSDDMSLTPSDIVQEEERQHRERLRNQSTKEQFEILGRFVQAFELMVDAVRTGCILITTWTAKQQRLMNIVFHHKGVSADALFDMYRAMMAEILGDPETKMDPTDNAVTLAVLGNLANRYKALLNKRNDMLHGTWRIGWFSAEDTDFQSIWMHKFKATKGGLLIDHPARNVDDIKALITEFEEIEDIVRRLTGCFLFRDTVNIARNFKKDGERWTSAVPRQ